MNIKILDCTLRDGGYYNQWNFSNDLVKDYIHTMAELKVDYIEIGFRYPRNDRYLGPYFHSPDFLLESLKIDSKLSKKIAIMINAADLIDKSFPYNDVEEKLVSARESLFNALGTKKSNYIAMVRIATHSKDLGIAIEAARYCSKLGYIVGVNLMMISELNEEQLLLISTKLKNEPIDVLYFADSLGSMMEADIKHVVTTLRKKWSGHLGFHAHNNLSLALSNSLTAASCGVSFIDCTVTGMGRGAGNLSTELAMSTLKKTNSKQYISANSTLSKLISNHFNPLMKEHEWGTSLHYALAALNKIHPSYIQTMASDTRYKSEDIITAIDFLGDSGGNSFSQNLLKDAGNYFYSSPIGTWCPVEDIQGREVLIISNALYSSIHLNAVHRYIKMRNPYTINLNYSHGIISELINSFIVAHPLRIMADSSKMCKINKPIICPYSMLPDDIKLNLSSDKLKDFGLSVEAEKYEFNDTDCIIPYMLSLPYALSVATSGQASRILLAGFGGHNVENSSQDDTSHALSLYKNSIGAVELLSLTPTMLDINEKCVYGSDEYIMRI